ncbi:MAG: hypothetical protein IPM35_07435 [Myxococcales bacterium]|nr:hypothetical protein [Myxococcales bacterium]
MPNSLYVAACVVLPAVWGVLMYFAFGALERRRQKNVRRDAPPPIDYSI